MKSHPLVLFPMHVWQHRYGKLKLLQPRWILQGSNNGLNLIVVAKAVYPFFSPIATHLVPTKRYCSIKNEITVYPYCPNMQSTSQGVGSVHVLSKNSSSQPKLSCIRPSYHFIKSPIIGKSILKSKLKKGWLLKYGQQFKVMY